MRPDQDVVPPFASVTQASALGRRGAVLSIFETSLLREEVGEDSSVRDAEAVNSGVHLGLQVDR